jgi:cytochrome c553
MQDHFTQAIQALDAIVRGDRMAMKAPAEWLADHKLLATLPEVWKPHVGDLQNAARLALQANDLAVAADAMGAMGAACGRCHTELGVTLEFSGMSPEGKESSVLDRMLRHQWAADRMWEGLIGPSDLAWSAGVAALQEAPLHPDMLADNQSPPQAVVELAEKVHKLGQRGRLIQERGARAKLYGEYVATCAECHTQLGVQFGATRPPQR